MAATVTLSTTSLALECSARDIAIQLASTTGIVPGLFLYLQGELMRVRSLGLSGAVNVERGQDGTTGSPHSAAAAVYVGRGDQFYEQDPIGRPFLAVAVTPYINVRNGTLWIPQGDEVGPSRMARYWQNVTTTYGIGALGIRTQTAAPTVSS